MVVRLPLLEELTVWNTSACNLRCEYCFVYRLYEDIPRQEMQIETMDNLIHFAMHHLRANGRIWFFGGEPLVSFETMKYITEKARAENLAIQFGVTTNCTLIDEEKAKWMAKHGYGVLCSLDGLQELHDKHRKYADGRGSWSDAWNGIKLVRKYINSNPQLRWTMSIDTVEGTVESMKQLIKDGLTNLAIDCVYEVEWDEDALETLRKELTEMRDLLDTCYSNGIQVFSMFARDAANALMNKSRMRWTDRCGLGIGSVGVTPKGEVTPCHRFVSSVATLNRQELIIGDVYRGFNPNRLTWIEGWSKIPPYSEKPELCLECNFRNACSGGCIACNYDLFGDAHVVPESFCRIKQLTVEVFKPLVEKHSGNPTFMQLYGIRAPRMCIE